MIKIKERREEREQEIQGGWYLEEQMTKDLNYSKLLGIYRLLFHSVWF